MRQLERQVVLSVLDRKWREHLYEMDYLREGIGLRGYGQRDPLVEYQREGYDMFNTMMDGIKEESVGLLFNLQVQVQENPVVEEAPPDSAAPGAPVPPGAPVLPGAPGGAAAAPGPFGAAPAPGVTSPGAPGAGAPGAGVAGAGVGRGRAAAADRRGQRTSRGAHARGGSASSGGAPGGRRPATGGAARGGAAAGRAAAGGQAGRDGTAGPGGQVGQPVRRPQPARTAEAPVPGRPPAGQPGVPAGLAPRRLQYSAPSVDGGTHVQTSSDTAARGGFARVGRNDPCPCGSGRKFKRCHGDPRTRPDTY